MSGKNLLNILTGLLVIVAVGFIIFVVVTLLSPREEEFDASLLPTEVPTLTATFTLTPSTTPTQTLTPTETPTSTSTGTETPTVTPSFTITSTPGPTLTPSVTFTPSISPTFTPSLTPTGPTATLTPSTSPFPFLLRDPGVRYTTNFANTAGCAWQGIGGQVLDMNGGEVNNSSGFKVRVFNNEINREVTIGTNSLYAPLSGWEIPVDTQPNNRLYFVQLETSSGTPISPRIDVQFPGTCDQNVAIVVFIQVRPF